MAQLGLVAPKKAAYFGLYTPVALPFQCLLEMSGLDYEGQSVSFDEWAELKPKTPAGVLPYAEMPDGTLISESGAIGRVVAGAAGLLGSGNDFAKSEMLVGITADFNKKMMEMAPTIMTVEKFDDAKKKAYADGKEALVNDWTAKYVKLLTSAGDRFTESGTTFGEVDLFAKLYCHSTGAFPELATGGLKAFYDRMMAIEGIKKVLDGNSKFGKLAQYLVPMP